MKMVGTLTVLLHARYGPEISKRHPVTYRQREVNWEQLMKEATDSSCSLEVEGLKVKDEDDGWRDRRNDEDDGGGFGSTEDDDFVAPVSEALQGSSRPNSTVSVSR
jgi:hypothetical protein